MRAPSHRRVRTRVGRGRLVGGGRFRQTRTHETCHVRQRCVAPRWPGGDHGALTLALRTRRDRGSAGRLCRARRGRRRPRVGRSRRETRSRRKRRLHTRTRHERGRLRLADPRRLRCRAPGGPCAGQARQCEQGLVACDVRRRARSLDAGQEHRCRIARPRLWEPRPRSGDRRSLPGRLQQAHPAL